MTQIAFANKRNLVHKPFLIIAPILVSMGEMVFFSSNGLGVFCYILISFYLFYDDDKEFKESNSKLEKAA